MFPTFFIPSGVGDDYFGEVVLLLRGEGANGSTSFVDYSQYAHAATVNGGIQMDTAKMRNGRPSIKIGTSGDWLRFANHAAFVLGSNDFTIETWLWFDSFPGSGSGLADHMQQFQNHPASAWEIYFDTYPANPSMRFSYWSTVAAGNNVELNLPVPTGQWTHFAVNKTGGALRTYLDGVQGGVYDVTPGNFDINTAVSVPLYVGGFGLYSLTGTMGGWMSEFRITNGYGRYPTAGFTPPTDDFPLQ